MSDETTPKKLLKSLTLAAFERTQKSISIKVIEDEAWIYIGQAITEETEPYATVAGVKGMELIEFILENSKNPSKLTSMPFHNGFLDHGVIGDWSYNFGIVKQGSDTRWICSITASMTDAEIKAVKELSAESHYELDDLFEEAKKYDPDELIKQSKQVDADGILHDIAGAQKASNKDDQE